MGHALLYYLSRIFLFCNSCIELHRIIGCKIGILFKSLPAPCLCLILMLHEAAFKFFVVVLIYNIVKSLL